MTNDISIEQAFDNYDRSRYDRLIEATIELLEDSSEDKFNVSEIRTIMKIASDMILEKKI